MASVASTLLYVIHCQNIVLIQKGSLTRHFFDPERDDTGRDRNGHYFRTGHFIYIKSILVGMHVLNNRSNNSFSFKIKHTFQIEELNTW